MFILLVLLVFISFDFASQKGFLAIIVLGVVVNSRPMLFLIEVGIKFIDVLFGITIELHLLVPALIDKYLTISISDLVISLVVYLRLNFGVEDSLVVHELLVTH